MSKEPDVIVVVVTAFWTSPDYLNAIGGKRGDKVRRILIAIPLIPDNEPHLAALALIAARVDSYAEHSPEERVGRLGETSMGHAP